MCIDKTIYTIELGLTILVGLYVGIFLTSIFLSKIKNKDK
jgi:hypothetical protein